MAERNFLSWGDSRISWLRIGRGRKAVICFHGYGEEASSFDFLGEKAGDEFSFYAIDLPFHGQTAWMENRDFTSGDLSRIVKEIISKEKRTEASTEPPYFLGFSLGARVALSLYQSGPSATGKLILLAPDGLKLNFWYWLSTQTWAGRKFFRFTMKKPGWFFGFLKALNKMGLVNASIFKFVHHYIGEKEVRVQLYRRWTGLRKLKPRIRRIKTAISKQNTPTRLLYGKHDRIIRASVGERFRKGIEEQCTLRVIQSGHQVLNEKHSAEILALLRY